MTSTRLPGKVLKAIGGKSVLHYHLERLKQSGFPVYIATTTNASDDPVIEFCKAQDIAYYRGDEQNVLSRYYGCAKENELDIVVRVTSDCPLIAPELVKNGIEIYLKTRNPSLYLSNALERTFPRGFDFEIFSYALLERAFFEATRPEDLEHVTPYIHQNRTGDIQFYHYLHSEDKSNYRITLDTPEDFELLQALIEDYQADKLTGREIITLLDQHPELVAINAQIEQKKLTS
ncbi:acylneuraminate cytidylyltransferase [Adhaeribacter soli]|uniref:Acylneuraminate cytidylyltransferase n=2 Tax=Adhaeribacter soli TaxID=2607655 RepID=A0A5N1J7X3_9BACT|nr:acylneuraminate cytidylyltransferase [Adhaeribacter soli]